MTPQNKNVAIAISPELVKQAAAETSSPEEIFTAALAHLATDPAALYEDTVIKALKTIRDKDEVAYTRLVSKAKGHITKLDKLTASDRNGRDDNIPNILIQLAQGTCVLGHDPDARGVAVIDDGRIRQVYYLNSPGFDGWLRAMYFNDFGSGVSDQQIATAVSTLSAIAKHKGEELAVHLRCAKRDDSYYLDMCDDEWRAIRVDKNGWEIVSRPPILFIRTPNMRPLPVPQRPGGLDRLWASLNIPESQRVLVLTWLIDSYRPDTPFPILEWSGEQGSAKSTNQRRLRDLSDPNKVSLRGRPKTVEDIYIGAANNWVVSFENLSYLTPEQQDALCTLSTGGGYAARALYTNGDEHVLETKRPVMLNGINPVATQPDLIERVISIEAPTIPADQRVDEQTIAANWEADYPSVLAGVLDLFSAALKILPKVKLNTKYRMADFHLMGEAVSLAMGHPAGHFSEIYGDSVHDGIGRSMESYGVSNALQVFMAAQDDGCWEGTFLMLKGSLEALHYTDRSNWPKSPRALAGQLKRITPGLRRLGIEIESRGRSNQGSQLRITFSKGK